MRSPTVCLEQKCSVCNEHGHNSRTCGKTKKVCTGCKLLLPLENFYKHSETLSNGEVYRRANCCFCHRKRNNERYRTNLRYRLSQLLCHARNRAKKRKWTFDIDLNYLNELYNAQNGLCYYTGRQLSFEPGGNSMSLDRKHNDNGYTKDNVVLSLWEINEMKRDIEFEHFINICKNIANYMEGSNGC